MTRWQAVFFDLDDTLYAERLFVDGGFRAVGRFLAPHIGRSAPSIARRLRALHDRDGRGQLFDTLLSEVGRSLDTDLVQASLLAYRTHRPRIKPFPDVVATIDAIRGLDIATGVITDGLASVQERKLAALSQVSRRLDMVVLTDELGPGAAKPSPVPFRVACLALGVEAKRTVYVGNDPRKDFDGARRAGLATIRTGLFPDEGASDATDRGGHVADIVLDDFAAIPQTLASLIPGRHGR